MVPLDVGPHRAVIDEHASIERAEVGMSGGGWISHMQIEKTPARVSRRAGALAFV
jgi:hypothetical protein